MSRRSPHQLAHLNIARMRGPLDSPIMAGFIAQLDATNALADASEGFVWRMSGEDPEDPALIELGPLMLVNLSVWRDASSLSRFVYRSAHAAMLKERHRWFLAHPAATTVLWWIPGGQIPSLQEATARLGELRHLGPSHRAFDFRHLFDPPGSAGSS